MPTKHDLSIWKGNTEFLKFAFKIDETTPFNLTGSELTLTITHAGGTIVKGPLAWESADLLSGITYTFLTAAETRSITAPATYELERKIDIEQKILLYGTMLVSGGLNGD